MNVEPILNAVIATDRTKNNNSLKLYNEGINPIFDIHVYKDVFDFGVDYSANLSGPKSWKQVDTLAPRDSSLFHLEKAEIDLLLHNRRAHLFRSKDPKSAISIVAFSIRYRRLPDKRLYLTRKYLYVTENSSDSTQPIFSDLDENSLGAWNQQVRHMMDSVYANQLPSLKN